MTKWNTPLRPLAPNATNLAGGQAFQESDRLELASILLTSFAEGGFHNAGQGIVDRLTQLILSTPNKEFAAKATLLARTWGMRSITHVAAAELCAVAKGEKWLKHAISNIVQRPDDATEILSYWLGKYGKPIPNAMKRGLACGLLKFNEYQLGKYRGENHALKLVDVVNLVHALPTPAINALMKGTLAPPDTWEVSLTRAGSDPAKKAVAWRTLLSERKLGYFALLRNLRNIEQQAPDCIPLALGQLTNREVIKRSKVLPFRFDTALENVANNPSIISAISRAADMALDNVPVLEGDTLVALDVSGSMMGKPAQIGALFTAALFKRNLCDVVVFSTNAAYVRINPEDSVLSIARSIRFASGGTDFRPIFLTQKKYDRIIILSDMQAWVGGHAPTAEYRAYCKRTGADPYIWSFDLKGYGTLQFPEKKVLAIAGWSEKVFDLMPLAEKGKQALLDFVDAVDLSANEMPTLRSTNAGDLAV